jgi:hypothetical protein
MAWRSDLILKGLCAQSGLFACYALSPAGCCVNHLYLYLIRLLQSSGNSEWRQTPKSFERYTCRVFPFRSMLIALLCRGRNALCTLVRTGNLVLGRRLRLGA